MSVIAPARELLPAPQGPPPPKAIEALTQTFAGKGVQFVGPPLPALLSGT